MVKVNSYCCNFCSLPRTNTSPRGLWKIPLKYKVKQSTKGQFTSNYKASPIDFETQISEYMPLLKYAPQKEPLENISPRGLFSEFYGTFSVSFILTGQPTLKVKFKKN